MIRLDILLQFFQRFIIVHFFHLFGGLGSFTELEPKILKIPTHFFKRTLNQHVPPPFGFGWFISTKKMKDTTLFDALMKLLRGFFVDQKGFTEVPTQARPTILAACEQPETVLTYQARGETWVLPQTGQMILETEVLTRPDVNGVYCCTTSYRSEKTPIPGRHDFQFPLFEFESRGTMSDLHATETQLLEYLGFPAPVVVQYLDMCKKYNVSDIGHAEEQMIWRDFGPVVSLQHFPQSLSFFNMKVTEDIKSDVPLCNKIDVLLCGMETIGSAERACDPVEMKNRFYQVANGGYAEALFRLGKAKVEEELETFLNLPFCPRFGAGIGVTRLGRALKLLQEGKLNYSDHYDCDGKPLPTASDPCAMAMTQITV